MDDRDFLQLESAITAVQEAAEMVSREVESGRLGDSTLAQLSTTEADLRRSQNVLEKILREAAERRRR